MWLFFCFILFLDAGMDALMMGRVQQLNGFNGFGNHTFFLGSFRTRKIIFACGFDHHHALFRILRKKKTRQKIKRREKISYRRMSRFSSLGEGIFGYVVYLKNV